jgi:hypothetical protein
MCQKFKKRGFNLSDCKHSNIVKCLWDYYSIESDWRVPHERNKNKLKKERKNIVNGKLAQLIYLLNT